MVSLNKQYSTNIIVTYYATTLLKKTIV